MSRLGKFQAVKTTHNVFARDTREVLATYERVNTAAPVYVDVKPSAMLKSGAGDVVASLAKTLYGDAVVTQDVQDLLAGQMYHLCEVFSPASDNLVKKSHGALNGVIHQDLFDDNNNRIALALYDVDGAPVYMRCKRDGSAYLKRYSFASFFNAFVAPVLVHHEYETITKGNVTIRITPVKSVSASASN